MTRRPVPEVSPVAKSHPLQFWPTPVAQQLASEMIRLGLDLKYLRALYRKAVDL